MHWHAFERSYKRQKVTDTKSCNTSHITLLEAAKKCFVYNWIWNESVALHLINLKYYIYLRLSIYFQAMTKPFFLASFWSAFFVEDNTSHETMKLTKSIFWIAKTFTIREICAWEQLKLILKTFKWYVKAKQLIKNNSRQSTIYANNLLTSIST